MEISRAEAELLHSLIQERAKTNPFVRNGFIHKLDIKLQAEELWHGAPTTDAHQAEIEKFLK